MSGRAFSFHPVPPPTRQGTARQSERPSSYVTQPHELSNAVLLNQPCVLVANLQALGLNASDARALALAPVAGVPNLGLAPNLRGRTHAASNRQTRNAPEASGLHSTHQSPRASSGRSL